MALLRWSPPLAAARFWIWGREIAHAPAISFQAFTVGPEFSARDGWTRTSISAARKSGTGTREKTQRIRAVCLHVIGLHAPVFQCFL